MQHRAAFTTRSTAQYPCGNFKRCNASAVCTGPVKVKPESLVSRTTRTYIFADYLFSAATIFATVLFDQLGTGHLAAGFKNAVCQIFNIVNFFVFNIF